jgi:GTP-binding protein HflX
MTGASVFAENQLFATLDPTMRRIEMADIGAVIMADTVGFISHLPHKLVEAFRATLEEAANSTLLLHIIDAAADERLRNIQQVELVLGEIGAAELPQLKVYNKIDLLEDFAARIDRDDLGKPVAVWLSAQSGAGCNLLCEAIAELLGTEMVFGQLVLGPQAGRLRAALYAQQAITQEVFDEDGAGRVTLRIPKSDLLRILSAQQISFEDLVWSNEVRGQGSQFN